MCLILIVKILVFRYQKNWNVQKWMCVVYPDIGTFTLKSKQILRFGKLTIESFANTRVFVIHIVHTRCTFLQYSSSYAAIPMTWRNLAVCDSLKRNETNLSRRSATTCLLFHSLDLSQPRKPARRKIPT